MNDSEFKMRVIDDLATIKAMARQTDKDVHALQKCVYGNGKMGLKTQVFILWGVFLILGGTLLKVVIR